MASWSASRVAATILSALVIGVFVLVFVAAFGLTSSDKIVDFLELIGLVALFVLVLARVRRATPEGRMPKGVALLCASAVVAALSLALEALFALTGAREPRLLAALTAPATPGEWVYRGALSALGLVMVAGAVRRRPWGYLAFALETTITTVRALFDAVAGPVKLHPPLSETFLRGEAVVITLAFTAFFVWYLTRRGVRAWFHLA